MPSNRLRTHRTAAGVTVTELANAVGVSRQTITRAEHDYRWPKQRTRDDIAATLGVPTRELFPPDAEPIPTVP